jgi:HEAT repeat protein
VRVLLLMGLLTACGPSSEDIAQNLSSDNPVVREDTAKIAHNFDSDVVRTSLLASLQDPAAKVRYNALNSLITLEAVESVPAILAMLEIEDNREVELLAIDALGRFKDAQAVPRLIEYIEARRQESDRSIPLNAIWALGFIGDAQALPLLITLRESSDIYVSSNASRALAELRPAAQ